MAPKINRNILGAVPTPISPLNKYRLLSPSGAVRVSPLCLGAMSFGSGWFVLGAANNRHLLTLIVGKDIWETATAKPLKRFLTFFINRQICVAHVFILGNFIDTSNNYQLGESETIIGEWMKKRENRDELVIATKYTTNYENAPDSKKIKANYTGNGSKSLHVSVEASLKKLQTDYIDILYVHWWDFSTSTSELMQSLNNLVVSGKVLYLGISDSPAWVVSKANEYARNHGLRQFSVYQGRWSAASRDFERDIIPMVKSEGMALAPWGALGAGRFKTEEQRKAEGGRNVVATTEEITVSKVLEIVANRKNSIITSVALAYVMHKAPYVFPIVGGRKVEQLRENIAALSLKLTEEDIAEIEAAVPFALGFYSGKAEVHLLHWASGSFTLCYMKKRLCSISF
ncbi:aldo/keto reductase [Trichoderma gamsii]|uniref:Aldo/keto reductase n=1 Tax=Trichoderma gamsii TaxID=398673 RepID=A0A2P4ZE56_9HYPO|nr:aldo/keto reductase [Trichoderma gamsii]PON22573.1 aldo/keto reductase [Trichoderma gamsii]